MVIDEKLENIKLDIIFKLQTREMWESGLMFWNWENNELNLWVRDEGNIQIVQEKAEEKCNAFLKDIQLSVGIFN